MRLGHEMRRRVRDRSALTEALRDAGRRMTADAVLLWMPHCGLRVHLAMKGTEISVPVATEFDDIHARVASMKQGDGRPLIFQGDDARIERRTACRLLIVPVDTGTARFPAWLVFARELVSPRFDTWAAVLAQVQSLRLSRALSREFDLATGHLSGRGLRTALTQRTGRGCLVLADLDGLRSLNHTRGMSVGDDVIAALGQLLEPPLLPAGTMVAHLEGGKFALCLAGVDTQAAAKVAMDLQTALANVQIKNQVDFPRLTLSCGIAEYDHAGELFEKVLLAADLVLRLAKERGRSRIETHESNDASVIRQQDEHFAATDLREAIRTEQLDLYAQPIVSLRNAKHPLGFELLLRRRDDADNADDAGRLIAVAQRYNMLPLVDRYVVDRAFAMLAPHREVLARLRITVGINVSGQSICDAEFTDHFIDELKRAKLPSRCITVEVTEQSAVGNLAKASEAMRRLRAAGCGIAIDDFGTGANSLAYVHQLPVTRLKIDGSFVRDITTNKKSEAAVRGIVQLARDFVLQTVGEYVEDEQQAELLRRLGVDFGQGYLYGKAEPLDATLAALAGPESTTANKVLDVG
jgi:diguanylate cyclase (GGDEF)-like protein